MAKKSKLPCLFGYHKFDSPMAHHLIECSICHKYAISELKEMYVVITHDPHIIRFVGPYTKRPYHYIWRNTYWDYISSLQLERQHCNNVYGGQVSKK